MASFWRAFKAFAQGSALDDALAFQVRVEDFSSYIGKLSTPRELVSALHSRFPLQESEEHCDHVAGLAIGSCTASYACCCNAVVSTRL